MLPGWPIASLGWDKIERVNFKNEKKFRHLI